MNELNELYAETSRAEIERDYDAQQLRLIIIKEMPSPDYNIEPNASSLPTVTLTSQNQRAEQQDRAGARRIPIKCPATVLEAKEVLEEVIKLLAKHTDKNIPGSTLVASIAWIENARWLHEGAQVVHVLTANLGDSRAMACRTFAETTDEALTRLTCEHILSREHEKHELERRGFTLKKISATETHIFLGETLVARQLVTNEGTYNYPFMQIQPGLNMTRSLGDAGLHQSPFFSRIPSFSLASFEIGEEKEKDIYLITVSDGITGSMADEDVAEVIMFGGDKTFTEAAKTIAKKAKIRGAHDNLSVVITGLHNLLAGEVLLQFVADGHGGSETSQFVADNIETIFRYVMLKKRLTPCQLIFFNKTIAQTESGAIPYSTAVSTIEYYVTQELSHKTILEDKKYDVFRNIIGKYLKKARAEKITYYEALYKTLSKLYKHFGEDSRIKDLLDSHRTDQNISLVKTEATIFEMITELHKAQCNQSGKRPYPGFDYIDPALVPTQKRSSQPTQSGPQPY